MRVWVILFIFFMFAALSSFSYIQATAHKNFSLPPITGSQNCGPGCCSTLAVLVMRHWFLSRYICWAPRYGPCLTRRSNNFTCHPHTNHTCLYSPATRRHRLSAGTHCAYPRRDGLVQELTGVAGYIHRKISRTGKWTRTRSPIPVLTGPDIG